MDKPQSKILAVVLLLALAGVLGYYAMHLPSSQPKSSSYTPPKTFAEPAVLISVDAPDGNATINMKTEKNGNQTTYTFTVSGNVILTKTLSSGDSMSIPFNTFSPNDKYLFLKQVVGGETSFFEMPSAGGPQISITDTFYAKYQNLKITDVTGWGGMNLIVINTDKMGGGIGPSFWFEIGSNSIIPLATRFN